MVPKYYTTKSPKCYMTTLTYFAAPPAEPRLTKSLEYYTKTYVVRAYYNTKAPVYYTTTFYYTTTYASSNYYTEAPKYCIEKLEPKSRTASKTYGAPVYYTEEPNELWRHAAVGCCIVHGWVNLGCTYVSCVWWISSDSSDRTVEYVAALLHNVNIRNTTYH
ncbi:hypothetical protein DAPPUDRAFT_232924 [Daphnia pulex]|uniref:Uncharacterized protein n=1 Tax=Daphnia pulex TaxID=6669 RepID=E9FSQ5_DAPPU|nr:hypothetical protein DAPPUDRAFT_232924 [Daphnia pulex]|eukprot:EFX89782.1 hypothetical protein DAPPUDRAFT_232924 [Daphnia pulex]